METKDVWATYIQRDLAVLAMDLKAYLGSQSDVDNVTAEIYQVLGKHIPQTLFSEFNLITGKKYGATAQSRQ